MFDPFDEIIEKIGSFLNLKLKVDENDSCIVIIDEKLGFQIEMKDEKILIGTFLIELNPGSFRRNVFTNALKFNSQIPTQGTFSFNEKNSALTFFEYFHPKDENLKTKILFFINTALEWKDSLDKGETRPPDLFKEEEKPPPFLGLK